MLQNISFRKGEEDPKLNLPSKLSCESANFYV